MATKSLSKGHRTSMPAIRRKLFERHKIAISEDHLFLDKIITNDLIHNIIFTACSPMTLVRFAKTCQRAYAAIRFYYKRAFSINRILSRYFSDPIDFRCLQARTGALIIGSTALQFFDRSFWPDSDLDIIVPAIFGQDVGRWLINNGYEFIPDSKQDPDFEVVAANRIFVDVCSWHPDRFSDTIIPQSTWDYMGMRGVLSVFTFVKSTPPGTSENSVPQPGLKVKVILVRSPAVSLLENPHCTVEMNIISFEEAYCLYPGATLEERRALVIADLFHFYEDQRDKVVREYADRGWTMLHYLPGDPGDEERTSNKHSFALRQRWIGDSYCWSIPLDLTGRISNSARYSRDPIAANSWILEVMRDWTIHSNTSYDRCQYIPFHYYAVGHDSDILVPLHESMEALLGKRVSFADAIHTITGEAFIKVFLDLHEGKTIYQDSELNWNPCKWLRTLKARRHIRAWRASFSS